MNDTATTGSRPAAYGTLTEPATVKIQRLLPGPIERCWAWLTDADLRRRWLADGDMDLRVGAAFELTWRNDQLTSPPGTRPEGFGAEHSMKSVLTEVDPPRRLAFTWDGSGDVSFDLEPVGDKVMLTVIHRRLPSRTMMLNVSAGWHAHLDILVARANGIDPEGPFWDGWGRLKQDYDKRLPA
ncbi:SRPBCC family protein [uncultured Alsobacter sp.]|uniref:SRPBCC family protein n=1 Tax=uncultured Alsobacter sp. TaxID=1748258 RepID=UPI0025CD04B9|nr:SRPBCC family protein [uncultured Alsobacter sp.]